jgi:anti-sigma B factor antagonist
VGFEAVVSQDTPGRYQIGIGGELAFPDSDDLVELVAGLVAESGAVTVVVDVDALEFLDSSGVRALLQARQATLAKDGSLTVTGAQGTVAEVLRITGVDALLYASD